MGRVFVVVCTKDPDGSGRDSSGSGLGLPEGLFGFGVGEGPSRLPRGS